MIATRFAPCATCMFERRVIGALAAAPAAFDARDSAQGTASQLAAALVRLELSGEIERRDPRHSAENQSAHSVLIERADFVWSLSSLTFLHEWARAIVVEQLYRAAKIARGESYHH
jgi:hypothetical protein